MGWHPRLTTTTASLTWNAATDNVGVTAYDIYQQGQYVKSVDGGALSATMSKLAPSKSYGYYVNARDAAGNVSSAGDPVTVATTRGHDPVGQVTQVTTDDDVPWGLAFLPDRSALITERDTHNVVRVTAAGRKTTVGTVPGVSGTDGEEGLLGLEKPVRTWSVAAASPSGLAITDDTLSMAALRGTQLWQMKIMGTTMTTPQAYFTGAYGRLRTVEPSPDGGLWLTTSSGDKDSTPNNSDDAILHVSLDHGR